MEENKKKIIILAEFFGKWVGRFIVALLYGIIAYYLWNWVAPLFSAPLFTYWQCVGICGIFIILFRLLPSKR